MTRAAGTGDTRPSLTETVDLNGTRFLATQDAALRFNPSGAGVSTALDRGELLDIGPAGHGDYVNQFQQSYREADAEYQADRLEAHYRDLREEFDWADPELEAQIIQREEEAERQAAAFIVAARDGTITLSATEVEWAFDVELGDAIQQGLVTQVHVDSAAHSGAAHYRSMAAYTQTVDIAGARFATLKETVARFDDLYHRDLDAHAPGSDWDDHDRIEAEDEYNIAVDDAIARVDLIYLEPAPSDKFAINGADETPIQERRREQAEAELEAEHEEQVWFAAADNGTITLSANEVEWAFDVALGEAVQQGLVTKVHTDGAASYRSMAAYTQTVDIDGARFGATPASAMTLEERYRATLGDGRPGSVQLSEKEFALEVNEAIGRGDLVYQERAPDRGFHGPGDASRVAATTLAAAQLGDRVRLYDAETLNGKYLGPVIGVTDLHIVQRVTAHAAVLHRIDAEQSGVLGALLADPSRPCAISYSGHTATVRELQRSGPQHDLARER